MLERQRCAWDGLFGCSSAPTYLRMEVGADGHVDFLVLRIAEDIARNLASLPSTYEAFEQLDSMLREHQQALEPYRARAGSAALQDAYEAAAAERAGKLWPGFFTEAKRRCRTMLAPATKL